MARPITDRAALDMNAADLTKLAEACDRAAAAVGSNSAEGRPFGTLAAALWDMLELRDEALARVNAEPIAVDYPRIRLADYPRIRLQGRIGGFQE